MKRVTIVDVAQRAGTSTAVVSYVLNPGSKPVSDTLRARVLAAVSDLDYRPHRHARALRRNAGWGQIGLLIPDVRLPLYGMLAGAIEREARAQRQLVLTGNTGFDATVEVELTRSFTDAGVDRLLVAGVGDGGAIAGICGESRTPIVWVHSNRGVVGTRIVGADHVQAGVLAAEHLTAVHGRRTTAFVGGFIDEHVQHGDRDTVRERYEGYASVVGAQARHITTDLTLDGAYQGVRAHLDVHGAPDGLVVGTFFQSTAAVRALTDAGLRIPADVSVVSFDGDESNKYSQIALTTVQQDIDDIARRSIDLPTQTPTEDDALPPRAQVALAIAESCGCSSTPRTEAG